MGTRRSWASYYKILIFKRIFRVEFLFDYFSKRGALEGSTLEDVRVDPATQHHNTSHRRLYDISVGSTYMCRSERCRSVLFNTIFEVLDISRSSMLGSVL